MSDMDEKVEEPQEQPSDSPLPQEVSPEKLEKILEAHWKWVESGFKKGDLANLQGACLDEADLQGADLERARGLIISQVMEADNWTLALYSDDFLKELGLPPDHDERVRKKLAEIVQGKKASATNP